MSGALLRKELSEHGAVLGVTALLAALVLFALLVQAESELGGRFVGLTRFSMLFGFLIPIVLANRLLVREYAGRTQLFLETLPLGRARAFATKWLLGCVLSMLTAVLAWAWTVETIVETEALGLRDALAPLPAVLTFWFTAWCFASMAGMLGRYRYVVWAIAALLVVVLESVTGMSPAEAPVLRLLGSDVQMGRALPEPSAFAVALGIALVSLAGAAALALIGSGAMPSALAQRMTARERVFVLVGIVAAATLSAVLERSPELPPFEIADGERVEGRHVRVGVMPTADFDAARARSLAHILADDADSLIDALSLEVEPAIFVLPQQGLDRDRMQRASLSGSKGVVIRIASDAPLDRVRALVGHALIVDSTRGRALREDRHVLLDGLSAYWALRDDADARRLWRLRAAAAGRPLREDDLALWSQTMERLGECTSLAVAFGAFEALVERLGVDAALALMADVFRTPPDDFRVLFEAAPEARLARSGVGFAALAAQTEAALGAVRERHRELLAGRPAVDARIEQRTDAGPGNSIEVHVDGAERFTVHYARLRPWAGSVGETPRLDVQGSRAVLPIAPIRGDRVFVAVEVDDAALDCPIRIAAERVTIR